MAWTTSCGQKRKIPGLYVADSRDAIPGSSCDRRPSQSWFAAANLIRMSSSMAPTEWFCHLCNAPCAVPPMTDGHVHWQCSAGSHQGEIQPDAVSRHHMWRPSVHAGDVMSFDIGPIGCKQSDYPCNTGLYDLSPDLYWLGTAASNSTTYYVLRIPRLIPCLQHAEPGGFSRLFPAAVFDFLVGRPGYKASNDYKPSISSAHFCFWNASAKYFLGTRPQRSCVLISGKGLLVSIVHFQTREEPGVYMNIAPQQSAKDVLLHALSTCPSYCTSQLHFQPIPSDLLLSCTATGL